VPDSVQKQMCLLELDETVRGKWWDHKVHNIHIYLLMGWCQAIPSYMRSTTMAGDSVC